jgi:SPP1 gp7 family putative phage head morphogenesis protein
MNSRVLSSRLAARAGIRQVEAVVKADAAALAADRAVAAFWQELLAILRDDRGWQSNYDRTLAVLRRLPAAVAGVLYERLSRIAYWGHRQTARMTVDVLPDTYLRAASPVPVETIQEARKGGSVEMQATVRGLRVTDRAKPLREPARALSDDQKRKKFADLIFPPPARADVDRIVYSPTAGRKWTERVSDLSKLAPPEQLARTVAAGMASGHTQSQIARELLPAMQGVRSSARRVARTEGIRVAQETQLEAWGQMGDLIAGYQVHATLDQYTRPHHAARSGTIFYKHPKPGQLGLDKMPRPPMEADGSVAHNCRCYLTAVMAPPAGIANDPKRMALFSSNAGKVVPDPSVYSEWFDRADERRRAVAVGARRYAAVKDRVGPHRRPAWADFLDPETGRLVPLDALKAETEIQRAKRAAKVRAVIAQRQELVQQASTYGFLPDDDLAGPEPVVPPAPTAPRPAILTASQEQELANAPTLPIRLQKDSEARSVVDRIKDLPGLREVERLRAEQILTRRLRQDFAKEAEYDQLIEAELANLRAQIHDLIAVQPDDPLSPRRSTDKQRVRLIADTTASIGGLSPEANTGKYDLNAKTRANAAAAAAWVERMGVQVAFAESKIHVAWTHLDAFKDWTREAVLQEVDRASCWNKSAIIPGDPQVIVLPRDEDTDVAVHELGHAIENSDKRIARACREFLAHRVGNEPPKSIKELFPDSKYEPNETGRKDHFDRLFSEELAYYVGKDYGPDSPTEILSMGLQALYNNPVEFAEKDPEYFCFVVGIIRGTLTL